MTLTETIAKKAKPADKRFELSDRVLRGLKLVVEPSGMKNWRYRTTIRGRRQWISVGHHVSSHERGTVCGDCMTLKAAREEAPALAAVERGKSRAQIKSSAMTFGDVTEVFLKERHALYLRAERGGITYPDMRRHANRLAKSPLWDMPITEVDSFAVADFVEPLNAKYTSMAKRFHTLIGSILKMAVKKKWVRVNAARAVELENREKTRTRYLFDHEIKKIWPVWSQADYPGAVFQLVLLTCCRPKEIQTLEWSRIDFESRQAFLPTIIEIEDRPFNLVKNQHDHIVHLSPLAIEILQRARQATTNPRWVFPAPRNPSKPVRNVYRFREEFQKEAGVDYFQLRDLRATGGTIISREFEVDEAVISTIMNHKPNGMTAKVYLRHKARNARRAAEAVDQLSGHIEGLISQ